MLTRGDAVPHFTVQRADGSRVRYRDLWQRRNLVLVSLAAADAQQDAAEYARALTDRTDELDACDADLVITADELPDLPRPAVLVADRWGEIAFAAAGAAADLPGAGDVVEWARYVQHKCPECEGEAR